MRFLPAALIFAAMCASGQISTSITPTGGAMTFGMPSASRAITGSPYSAEQVSENVQTLTDGTHITRKEPSIKVFRDSLGRTRTERSLNMPPSMMGTVSQPPIFIEIVDPVTQLKYTLDTANHVAHRQHLPEAPSLTARRATLQAAQASPARVTVPEEMRPRFNNEKLGAQNIEGVEAEGTRSTTTYPVGSQGNDRPLVAIHEMWMSKQLGILVMSKNSDPRYGENTWKLTNISVSEPSANLFLPPPEYSVVDDAGEVKIQWGSQK